MQPVDIDITEAAVALGLPFVPEIDIIPNVDTVAAADHATHTIRLAEHLLDPKSVVSILARADTEPYIPVKPTSHRDWLRFVIGHELGHFAQAKRYAHWTDFMHDYNNVTPRFTPDAREYRESRFEHEADLIGAHVKDLIKITPRKAGKPVNVYA